jgi:hypothetical protein
MIHRDWTRVTYLLTALNFGLLSVGCGSDSGGAAETSGGSGSQVAQTGGRTSSSSGTTGGSGSTSTSTSCIEGESNCFSFFVTSRARLFALAQAFNGSTKGWGGDLRYGTGDGLTGADKICTEIAEKSLPGNGRTWKAFLSTSSVNAISRVGSGPWYDRLNRTIAKNLTELAATRPGGITNSTILNNLPNEDGTPHHNEEAACTDVNSCADNHDVMTGSDSDGKVCTASSCSGGMGGAVDSAMDGSLLGAMDAGLLGAMDAGLLGAMDAGFPGAMDAGFPGAMDGSFPGATDGAMLGVIDAGLGGANITDYTCQNWTLGTSLSGIAPRVGHTWLTGGGSGSDDWISQLTEGGCAPGYNLAQNGSANANGTGTVGEGGGYGAFYCLASN